jgi:DNA invertase Pin-like site-specific DNA recombinase
VTVFGYARVSTTGQDLDSQVEKLKALGATKTYREKISGARSDRPELRKLISALQPGDVLMVTRVDRLARSTRDLLNVLDEVGKSGATFKSIADSWADTTTSHGKLVLTILGGIAEFERDLIRVRTSEGRARAVARGVKLGPKRKLGPAQVQLAKELRQSGKSLHEIAVVLKVSHMTIRRVVGARRPDGHHRSPIAER